VENYVNGKHVVPFPELTIDQASFNPYAIPTITVPDALKDLPETTVKRNGLTYTGRFIDDSIVFGTVTSSDESYTGSFDANGDYHGLGKRTLKDGTTQEGLFIQGVFRSGKLAITTEDDITQTQIGTRDQNGHLSGDNCRLEITYSDGSHTLLHGAFKLGELVKGTKTENKQIGVPYPFEVSHSTFVDPEGAVHYSVNEQEVLVGRPPSDPKCAEVLIKEKAPLLLDPKKAEVFEAFLKKLPILTKGMWYRFEKTLPERAALGKKVATAILGQDIASSSIKGIQKHWKKIAEQLPLFSPEDQLNFTFFIAEKGIKSLSDRDFGEYCRRTFKNLISADPSVLQGNRIQCRHDYRIEQQSHLDFPIFAAFMEVAKSSLSEHLPHITTTISIAYKVHNDAAGTLQAIYFTDTDRFSAAFNAFFPNNTLPVNVAIPLTQSSLGHAFNIFNAFIYGISETALNNFAGNGDIHYLNDNAFYRLAKTVSSSDRAAIRKWELCAIEALRNPEIPAKRETSIFGIIWSSLGLN